MRLSVLILLSVVLLKILGSAILYLDFKLHQEQLAREKCVQRNEPITICRANCVLVSKLEISNESEEKQPSMKSSKELEQFIISEMPHFDFLGIATSAPIHVYFPWINEDFSSNIEKPPEYIC
ncbi:hypothetical protein GCM10007049_34820 [Echinicola pacifica]|uniref:Uncharacterized protein n=1 Tax=Echinicola pacifica TaxID=346377 RepID=A0A918QBX2_9BACT|nr:hypothetical protein [Echinicola pacifica]GGZ38694.1 hypothetical protein GCM10007049_34820 [Echinicola pacifica]